MSVLYVALPAALLLGGAAMLACVACIRRGQFDDLETPAVRMLIDERPVASRETSKSPTSDRE
jgi:cbb3-type cytochrome oxidase maturation protein